MQNQSGTESSLCFHFDPGSSSLYISASVTKVNVTLEKPMSIRSAMLRTVTQIFFSVALIFLGLCGFSPAQAARNSYKDSVFAAESIRGVLLNRGTSGDTNDLYLV
jgi:hypothetical protein